jgi:hypothetical protein
MANSIYVNESLDIQPTEKIYRTLLDLSLSSLFSVEIKNKNFGGYSQEYISLLAYEAVLPGTSFNLNQVVGDRQGVTEQYPNQRVYPPVDVSFYIKADYGTISFFENWMNQISPLFHVPNEGLKNSYFKFKYPDNYETEISIVKYERDGRPAGYNGRLKPKGMEGATVDPRAITYTLLNAYPTNIISIPLSYEQSSVLKTTITFNYDRYIFQKHKKVNPK